MADLHVIHLGGTYQEIGLAHGEQLRERIAETATFYNEVLFRGQHDLIHHQGELYKAVIESYNPDFATEIRAIARAADQPVWQIAALNARTEIYQRIEAAPKSECTSAYFPDTCLLGQNWDWMEPMEQLVVVMEITYPDGHRILQLTEPGIIGKIGLNSSGLGVCLNILTGPANPPRVPVHIVLRRALECKSIDDFASVLEQTPLGTYSNILVADDKGQCRDMEICGDHFQQIDYGTDPIVHTNHFLSEYRQCTEEATDPLFASSRQRFTRGSELYAGAGSDLLRFKRMLADESGAPLEICRAYRLVNGQIIGTVSSLIMDLNARKLHITMGKCSENPWHTLSVN